MGEFLSDELIVVRKLRDQAISRGAGLILDTSDTKADVFVNVVLALDARLDADQSYGDWFLPMDVWRDILNRQAVYVEDSSVGTGWAGEEENFQSAFMEGARVACEAYISTWVDQGILSPVLKTTDEMGMLFDFEKFTG